MVRALRGELRSTSTNQYKDTRPSHNSSQSLHTRKPRWWRPVEAKGHRLSSIESEIKPCVYYSGERHKAPWASTDFCHALRGADAGADDDCQRALSRDGPASIVFWNYGVRAIFYTCRNSARTRRFA